MHYYIGSYSQGGGWRTLRHRCSGGTRSEEARQLGPVEEPQFRCAALSGYLRRPT